MLSQCVAGSAASAFHDSSRQEAAYSFQHLLSEARARCAVHTVSLQGGTDLREPNSPRGKSIMVRTHTPAGEHLCAS